MTATRRSARPITALLAIVGMSVLIGSPALADVASTGDGSVVRPVPIHLTHPASTSPVKFLNPSSTPYGVVWGVDNRLNEYAIAIQHVTLTYTYADPTCEGVITLSSPDGVAIEPPLIVAAGGIGNPDAQPNPPYHYDPGFLFQASGSDCEDAPLQFRVTIEYLNVAQAAIVTGSTEVLVDNVPVAAPVSEGTTVDLSAEFTLDDTGLPQDRDFATPTGVVQFYVDGAAYGDPVPYDGSARLPAELPAGQHSITAVLSDPIYGQRTAEPVTLSVVPAVVDPEPVDPDPIDPDPVDPNPGPVEPPPTNQEPPRPEPAGPIAGAPGPDSASPSTQPTGVARTGLAVTGADASMLPLAVLGIATGALFTALGRRHRRG